MMLHRVVAVVLLDLSSLRVASSSRPRDTKLEALEADRAPQTDGHQVPHVAPPRWAHHGQGEAVHLLLQNRHASSSSRPREEQANGLRRHLTAATSVSQISGHGVVHTAASWPTIVPSSTQPSDVKAKALPTRIEPTASLPHSGDFHVGHAATLWNTNASSAGGHFEEAHAVAPWGSNDSSAAGLLAQWHPPPGPQVVNKQQDMRFDPWGVSRSSSQHTAPERVQGAAEMAHVSGSLGAMLQKAEFEVGHLSKTQPTVQDLARHKQKQSHGGLADAKQSAGNPFLVLALLVNIVTMNLRALDSTLLPVLLRILGILGFVGVVAAALCGKRGFWTVRVARVSTRAPQADTTSSIAFPGVFTQPVHPGARITRTTSSL